MQTSFINANSQDYIESAKKFCDEYNDIDVICSEFLCAINIAATAGYGVIQLHAAHGYGLSLLLSRNINECNNPKDTKGYKIIKKIVSNISERDFILDIRISLYEGISDNASELKYKMCLFEALSELGFDIISLSNGLYNVDKNMIYPPKSKGVILLHDALDLSRTYQNVIWNVAGNMEFIDTDNSFPDNLTISLGRQLIADPLFIEKCYSEKKKK